MHEKPKIRETVAIEYAAATNIQDLPAYVAPPTTNVAPPTANIAPPTANVAPPTANIAPPTANVAPPTTSTASSSRGGRSAQLCRVFTIPPDLPLTEDE
eukprot:g18447.t1